MGTPFTQIIFKKICIYQIQKKNWIQFLDINEANILYKNISTISFGVRIRRLVRLLVDSLFKSLYH